MKLERRHFLKTLGTGAVLSSLPSARLHADAGPDDQLLHQDYQSNNSGTEYFLLGNGLIFAALQTAKDAAAGTHCGLMVMSPEHFGRKISTYLYHPERGLQNSRCTVAHGAASYVPDPTSSTVRWEYPDGVPTVVAEWNAGGCIVREEYFVPPSHAAVVRTVSVKAPATGASDVRLTVLLYPNLMYFDEYDVDRVHGTLTARGYKTLRLFCLKPINVGDRHMTAVLGSIPPGGEQSATFVLTLDTERHILESRGLDSLKREAAQYWKGVTSVNFGHAGLDHLYRVSASGLRSAVSRSGKMDGSIWQYNLEWVRDQSMVAAGSAMVGLTDVSGSLLSRILSQSVDETGKTVDASRHRPPETMELDQNGELLYALYMHWVWSGDDTILHTQWPKIKNVADYVLRPEFRDPAIGLLKNSREYWERDPGFGIREGYENSYQFWNILGLNLAAEMALHMNDSGKSREWRAASEKMRKAYIGHGKYSLVDKGRLIKRRLANGEVQRTMEPVNRKSMPEGMPLNVESVSYCDPDSSVVLPIAYGVVDPRSDLASKTLQSVEELWNQRWKYGGYGRYHVTSEPDSPGPWPFATLFIARAYYEAGNDEKVWRALEWLLGCQGANAGAWFEFYGERPTPPLPPVGIVVWTWAEFVALFVHHMLGVRPSRRTLTLRPRLLSGINEIKATVKLRGKNIDIKVVSDKNQFALIDGKQKPLKLGAIDLPIPTVDTSIEIHVSS
ncbi:MAG: hypothetical protein WEB33_10805 [Bacteroidota bacterium]